MMTFLVVLEERIHIGGYGPSDVNGFKTKKLILLQKKQKMKLYNVP